MGNSRFRLKEVKIVGMDLTIVVYLVIGVYRIYKHYSEVKICQRR